MKDKHLKTFPWHALGFSLCLALAPGNGQAQTYDFEDCEIGQKFTMWNIDTGDITDNDEAVAEVVADPKNPNNKVLHVTVKRWGTFITLNLPKELAGHLLTDQKNSVTFDLYRPSTDTDDYKQFHAYLGKDKLYQDDSYPYQGNRDTWIGKSYSLDKVNSTDNDETRLHMGLHHNNSEYYIDNIRLKGNYDDYFVADKENNLIDICQKNTSSDYAVWNKSILVPKGDSLDIRTSRYTYLNGKMEGEGCVNLYAGGERTYLGSNDKNNKNYHPDWSAFSGSLHIYPYKQIEAGAGFYGLVWMSGKTFTPDNAEQNAAAGNINGCLSHTKLFLHDGATLACETGKRGLRIGHLETEKGSTLHGYFKAKSGNDGYYMVGGDNQDATLAGRILPFGGNNLAIKVGLVKEGNGTYRITGNENLITGGLRIINGAVMVNNDTSKAQKEKLSGGIGHQTDTSIAGVTVMGKGTIGGIGSIGSTIDLYGTLAPGDGGIGQLTVRNFMTDVKPNVILHPKAKIRMEVTDGDHYDRLDIDGLLTFDNRKEDFTTSEEAARIYIEMTSNPTLQVGDELTLITAQSKDEKCRFDIRYPKLYTWETEERKLEDGRFALIAKVISTEYGGQGEWTEDREEDSGEEETTLDIDKEKQYDIPLRDYVKQCNKYIGTCVSLYDNKINVDDENDEKTLLLAKQFNMVVCENEMKFDATEPTQGSFNYYNGDRLVNFAQRHDMRVRGHALVWHSQVPAWLSQDGKKNDKGYTADELQAIMKNHISNVVTHWKGEIAEWDVCNEVLDDDQSIVRTDPTAFRLRAASIWNFAGEDYIEKAFKWAHEADPEASLILNDYGVEFQGQAKAEAFYNLAKYLKDKGVPISGVGLQCHLDAGKVDIGKLKTTIQRFNAIGLKCVITELDLGMDDTPENRLQQAKDFYNIAKMTMEADNCNELMIWGLADNMTWRNNRNPLLYDSDLQAKDAYYGIHAAVREAAEKSSTGISRTENDDVTDSDAKEECFYNLLGQRIKNPQSNTFYIVSHKMRNGSVTSVKRINR